MHIQTLYLLQLWVHKLY